jgi:hypothetical protein
MLLGIIAMILSGTGLLMTATHDLEAHQAFTDALSITPAAVVVAVEVEVGKGVEEKVLVYESAVSSDDPGWADDSAAMEILAKYRTAEELKQAQREPVHVQLAPPTEEEEPDDELMCVDLSLLKPCDPCKSGIQGVTAGTIALSLVILLTGASKKTVRALFKRCRRSRVKQKSAGLP